MFEQLIGPYSGYLVTRYDKHDSKYSDGQARVMADVGKDGDAASSGYKQHMDHQYIYLPYRDTSSIDESIDPQTGDNEYIVHTVGQAANHTMHIKQSGRSTTNCQKYDDLLLIVQAHGIGKGNAAGNVGILSRGSPRRNPSPSPACPTVMAKYDSGTASDDKMHMDYLKYKQARRERGEQKKAGGVQDRAGDPQSQNRAAHESIRRQLHRRDHT